MVSDEEGKIFNHSTAWTIGGYYRDQDESLKRNYTYLENPYTSDYATKTKAIYGQFDHAVNDKTTIITGLRLEKWEADFSDSDAVKINTDQTLKGGKIGLNYQKDEDTLIYTTLSKGYKPGGVNADNSLGANAREYATEALWNLDAGLNSSFLDNQIKSRLNFFYGERINQQVKSSVVQVRDDGSTKYTDYLANAGRSHYYGVEAEFDYYLNDNLHLFSNVGLLKSKFDKYEDPNPSALKMSGRSPAQSPSYQYSVGGDYMIADAWTVKANVEGKGSYYFSNRHNEKADAYTLINSSLEYVNDNFTATLWARNLADTDYQVRGFGSFGNNPSKGYATELYTQQGMPRTFGATLAYDF